MELFHDFPILPLLLISLLTIFLLLKIISKRDVKNRAKLPPGPPRLPLIGNLHQLALSIPHRRLHQLAGKYGPLMHIKLGQVSTIVISSSEVAKEVMKTHDAVFANRPNIMVGEVLFYNNTDIAFSPYGDYWRKLRNICMFELLSLKRVQSFRPIREEETKNCIKFIGEKSRSTIDLSMRIFQLSNSITGRTALGIEGEHKAAFAEKIEEALKIASESGAADMFPSVKLFEVITGSRKKLEKVFEYCDKMLDDIVNEHKAQRKLRTDNQVVKLNNNHEREDLVDVLLKFEHDDSNSDFSLTTNNIKAVLMNIWAAGVETSASTVEWAMSEMLRNPEVMQKAQAEVRRVFQGKETVDESNFDKLDYLKLVIKETLRLHPPLPLILPRESSDRCQIFGYDIPPKTQALVNAWAIGRDPEVWTDPEMFKPDRFLDSLIDFKGSSFEFIPFGGGRRTCPGLSYGVAVVEIQLAMFLFHFDWKLPNGMSPNDLDMSESFGMSARKKNPLRVIPLPYPSSFVSQVI